MNFVRMGNSGLKITKVTFGSALTIGTENLEQDYADELIDEAWNLGIRSFDVANMYGKGNAERLVGNSLKRYPRQEYVVSTKAFWPMGNSPYEGGLSRKHVIWAFNESLARMNLEYVDIYYAHRYDPDTPMEEIVRTFNYLISTGKARYWATSEWPLSALEECHNVCDSLGLEKPIIEQCIYSFVVRKAEDNGVKEFCDTKGVGVMGFSPLCQGILTGKYRFGVPEGSRISKSRQIGYDKTKNFCLQNKKRIDLFLTKCDEFGVRPVDAAIQWPIRKGFYPVLGASKPGQLSDTLRHIDDDLGDFFWSQLEKI